MELEIKAPKNISLQPIITVFGVGGAGGNAVNNMIRAKLQGAKFVVANTDAQALRYSESSNVIQLGSSATKGLGAGASPDIGEKSALESEEDIKAHLIGSNMVFITAGMGGGTGTGASPIIAKIARDLGILTVGVVTKPFAFEGAKRMRVADKGLTELQKNVDTLIVIPNQNLFRVANENTTFQQAFEMADEVLHAGVRGVTDLITSPGLVNLDFADIETIMREKGKAMMGTGEASGEDRALKAAEAAINNPLLDQSSMYGACGVLINITGGKDMTLYEVDSAANRIREEIGKEAEANIIFGSTFNHNLEGMIRVSVVATGIEQDKTLLTAPEESDNPQGQDVGQYPPLFEEYNKSEMQQNLNHFVEELDLNKDRISAIIDKEEQEQSVTEFHHKSSLLKRMWNSLSGKANYTVGGAKDLSIRRQQYADQNIKETPEFLKKNK